MKLKSVVSFCTRDVIVDFFYAGTCFKKKVLFLITPIIKNESFILHLCDAEFRLLSHYFSLKISVLCTNVITESLLITNKASTHEFDWEFMHFNRYCDEIVIFFLGASDASPSALAKRTLSENGWMGKSLSTLYNFHAYSCCSHPCMIVANYWIYVGTWTHHQMSAVKRSVWMTFLAIIFLGCV